MYSSDPLGVQKEVGLSGLLTINIMIDALEKQTVKKGLMLSFEKSSREITLLGSSDLDASILQDILYKGSSWKYEGPYPHLEKEKSDKGDFKIKFSDLKPNQDRCCNAIECLIDHIDWEAVRHNKRLLDQEK